MSRLYYYENEISPNRTDFYILEETELGAVVEYMCGSTFPDGIYHNPIHQPFDIHDSLTRALESMGGNPKTTHRNLVELGDI